MTNAIGTNSFIDIDINKMKTRTITKVKEDNRDEVKNKTTTLKIAKDEINNILLNAASDPDTLRETKLALKFAIQFIQEAINHNGFPLTLTEPNICLTKESTCKIYSDIVNGETNTTNGNLKSLIEIICTHTFNPIQNRKFSLFGTNYTNTANKLIEHINNFTNEENKFVIDSKSNRVVQTNSTYDIANLSLQDNYCRPAIYATSTQYQTIVENQKNNLEGMWVVPVPIKNINEVWYYVLHGIGQKYLLHAECFLMDKTFDNRPETFTLHIYVLDRTDKKQILNTLNSIKYLQIIKKNELIYFLAKVDNSKDTYLDLCSSEIKSIDNYCNRFKKGS